MKHTGCPSLSLDSRPSPGQRTEGKSWNELMDIEIAQMVETQTGILKNQLEESLPPPIHPESGTKRDRKEIQSTEEDSDYGMVKDLETDANSHCNRFRKKLREGNGEQQKNDSDEQS